MLLAETVKALEAESDVQGEAAEKEKSMKTQVLLFTKANAMRKITKGKKSRGCHWTRK